VIRTTVTCHSETEYAQTPRAWEWEGTWQMVQKVIMESRSPEGKRFLVQTPDGRLFQLAYQTMVDQWFAHPVEKEGIFHV
jgi:hypothetical protein